MARSQGLSPNLNAFLDTIAFSELGPEVLAKSDDGYNVLVGATPDNVTTFSSYAAHPDDIITIRPGLTSTAAGRYQILHTYGVTYMHVLDLPDFGPVSQDKIAIRLICECDAMADVQAGAAAAALVKCSSRWASLPAATYGQHVNNLNYLLAEFTKAGGTISTEE